MRSDGTHPPGPRSAGQRPQPRVHRGRHRPDGGGHGPPGAGCGGRAPVQQGQAATGQALSRRQDRSSIYIILQ